MLKFGKLTEDSALTGKRYLQFNLNLPNCDTLKNNNMNYTTILISFHPPRQAFESKEK